MALQYVTVPLLDLGAGIDKLSSENAIKEGFSEWTLNTDPLPNGYAAKRRGYQGFAGYVPLRVTKVEYNDATTGNLFFYFDSSVDVSSIDFSRIRNTPIIVQGRTSSANSANVGDFPSSQDAVHYYPGFTSSIKRSLSVGTNTLVVQQSEHNYTTDILFVTVLESLSVLNNNSALFLVDSISIDSSTFDITITYTNGTAAPIDVFLLIQDKSSNPGTTYVTAPTPAAPGTSTIALTAGTHGLSNFNIMARLFVDSGTDLEEVTPDGFSISPSGTATFTITNSTAGSLNYVGVLSTVPVLNTTSGSAALNSTVEVTIIDLPQDFITAKCYLEMSIGGTLEEVIPNSVVVDTDARTATIEFVNSSPLSTNFFVYYENETITANKLGVDASVIDIADIFSDENPQLTLWGLSHVDLYGTNPTQPRSGWVNHIDSYKAAGDNRVIAGLGGNLFAARGYSEGGISANYLLPQLYPNIRGRVDTAVTVGPTFVDSTDVSTRTRGYIQCDNAAEGLVRCETIQYDENTGFTKYVLICPNLVVQGTLSTIISNTAGIEDRLLVKQAGYKENAGTFIIKQVSNPQPDILEISVLNPNRDSTDWDEQNSGAECGVFTDRLNTVNTATFIPGDALGSELFGNSSGLNVIGVSGTTLAIESFAELLNIPLGLRIVGQRTSRILPLRLLDGTATVENVVAGDMLAITGYKRKIRAAKVNPQANISVDIVSDGETATVTLQTGNTSSLAPGQWVLFIQAEEFTGQIQIATVENENQFTFESTLVSAGTTGTLLGNCVQLDENLLITDTVGSTVLTTVERRWIPIEAPEDGWDITPSTYVFHFTANAYANQKNLQSTMVGDNLYLTNGDDEVSKFDGTNIYRAGLPRWQPHLFLTKDETPASGGVIPVQVIATGTVSGVSSPTTKFTVPLGDELLFKVGNSIEHTADASIYTVTQTSDDGTDGFIWVERAITGTATGNLRKVHSLKYYFRLNAVDANSNIIASATVGSEDFRIELSASTQVRIRLIGLPVWDIYDYDKLEVEIYRPTIDEPRPFYRLTTLQMKFDNGTGYIDYIDSMADDVLAYGDNLDLANSALKGGELGNGWSAPLRSKYITSSNNCVVLGNITAYPEIDMRLVDIGTRITPAVLSTKILTLRKDNTDTGNTTDMLNRARYQFLTAGNTSIDGSTDITNNAGISFTVDATAHGIPAGGWVYLFHDSVLDGNNLTYAGWFQVNSVTTDSFTILMIHDSAIVPSADDVNSFITATSPLDIPVWMRTDGNYATRNGNRVTPGDRKVVDTTGPNEFIACRRLANAINASMRNIDYTLAGQEEFSPWVIANSGSEYSPGQIIFTQPKTMPTILEVQLWDYTGYNIYINSILRDPTAQASSQTFLFPSRILVSYPNFPEIFDSPTVILDRDSASAIDVNPADGQEITAIIPFFGDSTFGAAQQSGVVVVFKTNSIYLVDLSAKAAGQNPVQRIESRGLGCTAPRSVTVTKDGIMFATESGVYRLNKNMGIDEQGRYLFRYWRDDVNKAYMDLMVGHNYPKEKQYKLSIPLVEGNAYKNSNVLVYNSTREYTGEAALGSWTIYDNHPATGWANLFDDAYMATTKGQVFSVRALNENSDYRDDASAINLDLIFRAMDFGDSGIRKAVIAVILHFRSIGNFLNTTLLSATDLDDDFEKADNLSITQAQLDGLSDKSKTKILTVKYSIRDRKAVYIQFRLTNTGYDEPMEISKLDVRVSGLTDQLISDAAGFSSGK